MSDDARQNTIPGRMRWPGNYWAVALLAFAVYEHPSKSCRTCSTDFTKNQPEQQRALMITEIQDRSYKDTSISHPVVHRPSFDKSQKCAILKK